MVGVFEESTQPGTADAPEGAMQFYVERNMDTSEVASPTVIWVLPKAKTLDKLHFGQCKNGCAEHYPVILKLLSLNQQRQIAEAEKRAGIEMQCVVCVCRGKLIE